MVRVPPTRVPEDDLLHRRVLDALNGLVGQTLLAVTYWCLKGEATAASVLSNEFYIGGEVELRFSDTAPVFVSWDENAGWDDHFSLGVAHQSAFVADALEAFDASSASLWQEHVGSPLAGFSVLGWRETPHVLVLEFAAGRVLVGDGQSDHGFGDGDDVLLRCGEDAARLPEMSEAQVLWKSEVPPLAQQADVMLRFLSAESAPDPVSAIHALAKTFKAEGMPEWMMYDVFDRQRAAHERDADEAVYNAILDTMDRIVGWCSPHARLFDSDADNGTAQRGRGGEPS